MITLIIGIILLCIAGFLLYKANNIKIQKSYQQQSYNQRIEQLKTQYEAEHKLLTQLNQIIQQKEEEYKNKTDNITSRVEDFKKVSEQSANLYVETLQASYKRAEAAHTQNLTRLQAEYDQAAAALNSLKATRKAAYEAVLKEKEIKENKDNYRLLPSRLELEDIYTLEHIRKGLHKPRILSMLIWQTFWQPLAKEKFPIILQAKTKIGIYKITNIKTDQCYIGQSLDIYKRWCEHCKAGLGIDTPVGNKLYKAIIDTGLENFTFELLVECDKQELNEKEKYFIELYQSDLYGYNGTAGNK